MKKLEPFVFLDDKQWSPQWEEYLHDTLLFIPSKIQEILCITPIPDTTEIFISDSLKRLKYFGQYKIPWFCPNFALFPLESADQTIWLNPLKILTIFKHDGQYFVEMINGLILLLPISKRRVTKHAEIASLLLATISRGSFHTTRPGTTPLDFLDLPNTPFARYLSKRPLLQEFITPIGKLKKQYEISYALYHFPDLIAESDEDYGDNWL